jgi:hypothetical protein
MPAAHRLRRRARFAPAARPAPAAWALAAFAPAAFTFAALALTAFALALPGAAVAADHSEPADRAGRSATPQLRPVAGNPADRMLSVPIDDERYDRSRRCTRGPRAGTLALQAWLATPTAARWTGTSTCRTLPTVARPSG